MSNSLRNRPALLRILGRDFDSGESGDFGETILGKMRRYCEISRGLQAVQKARPLVANPLDEHLTLLLIPRLTHHVASRPILRRFHIAEYQVAPRQNPDELLVA
jgi:hypothetical protein